MGAGAGTGAGVVVWGYRRREKGWGWGLGLRKKRKRLGKKNRKGGGRCDVGWLKKKGFEIFFLINLSLLLCLIILMIL